METAPLKRNKIWSRWWHAPRRKGGDDRAVSGFAHSPTDGDPFAIALRGGSCRGGEGQTQPPPHRHAPGFMYQAR